MTRPISSALIDIFELTELQSDLSLLRHEQWTSHVNQRAYSSGWDAIPLRCASHNITAHPVLQLHQIEATTQWQYLPIVFRLKAVTAVLNSLDCELLSVRLMRLHPNGHIKPHRDKELSIEYGQARLHLPLQSHQRLQFLVNGNAVHMNVGELWYINADQIHEVINLSSVHRINLVIDCIANDWLVSKISQAQAN